MRRPLSAVAAAALLLVGAAFGTGVTVAATEASQAEVIGYQDGITGFSNWLKTQPGVQQRGPNYNPALVSTWPWPEKLARTLRILKDAHDAAVVVPPPPVTSPPPSPPPPAPTRRFDAPQTYNKGSSGQDARYCTQGLPRDGSGLFYEPSNPNIRYDDGGRALGGRSGDPISGLKPADAMDGREPCQGYAWGDNTYPPWPEASYQN